MNGKLGNPHPSSPSPPAPFMQHHSLKDTSSGESHSPPGGCFFSPNSTLRGFTVMACQEIP
ncbi:hypothetical protein [Prochlorothrix hollandica]|uniref:Uncharacterized protein n=1 Tax=Prochlorothrix hollandica PCC 9006 = CALU 1027 TaxID=317619 RepID=A0A0M2PVC5_PROHO|nr:hypothetical protein [Prochlorothrix hollandica]KKI99062.1 hypothetical protein PROH_14790 [Prochlorothrix hollandica PCC 9006 = CALU 1027]